MVDCEPVFSTKGFLANWRRRKEEGEGGLSSAANLAQINQKNQHLSYQAPGEPFSALYITYFQQDGRIKSCRQGDPAKAK